MSGKLDKSLDDILKTRRGAGTKTRRVAGQRAKATAPVAGGVSKRTRTAPKQGSKTPAAPTIPAIGNSKIIVSGLPSDVSEMQIKDYFAKSIGPVKSVFLVYGPNGISRGQATILFTQPKSAHEAATKLNGMKVDNRPMRIEVVLGANQAPVPVVKALGERIAIPKSAPITKAQPKSAVAASNARGAKSARGGAKKARGTGRATGRPKRKTAEELDAEMTDYFVPKEAGTNGASVNGATASTAVTGDASMDDQIM